MRIDIIEEMEEFLKYLESLRRKYKLCTQDDIADAALVTRQTVSNTLRMEREPNAYVVMAYISKLLWELMHDAYRLAEEAGVPDEEVEADRQNIITMMMDMSY